MFLNQTKQKDKIENYRVQPDLVTIFLGELRFYFASRRANIKD